MVDLVGLVTATWVAYLLRFDIGALRAGAAADLTLIRIVEGPAEFTDAVGGKRTGDLRLEHVSTVKDGRVYAPGIL